MQYTGTLKNAQRVHLGEGRYAAVGEIYNDALGRFEDGERIKTSPITREIDGTIHTKNSTYKIEWIPGSKTVEWKTL